MLNYTPNIILLFAYLLLLGCTWYLNKINSFSFIDFQPNQFILENIKYNVQKLRVYMSSSFFFYNLCYSIEFYLTYHKLLQLNKIQSYFSYIRDEARGFYNFLMEGANLKDIKDYFIKNINIHTFFKQSSQKFHS